MLFLEMGKTGRETFLGVGEIIDLFGHIKIEMPVRHPGRDV